MKQTTLRLPAYSTLFLVLFSQLPAIPFTYQGKLDVLGAPAEGVYDFEFSLWDDPATGSQVGPTLPADNVAVSGGLFILDLDFGGGEIFDGSTLWLKIRVKADADPGFTDLSPRQPIYPVAQSVYSSTTPWSGVSNIPTDIADGDDDTTYAAGTGLQDSGGVFSIEFGGSGSSTTAAHSDHDHWGQTWTGAGFGLVLSSTGSALLSIGRERGVTGIAGGPVQAPDELLVGVYGYVESADEQGAGVFASNASSVPLAPDLVLGALLSDNGVISSDPAMESSNLVLRSNDDITLYLNHDQSAENSSFEIRNANPTTIFSVDSSGNALAEGTVKGENGLLVGFASGDGLYISQAGAYASSGVSGVSNGVEVRSAANDGLMVGANGGDGVDIWNAAENGLYVRNAGGHGLHILNTLQNGIDIDSVGDFGIHISDGSADNYFAGDTGIGTDNPTTRLHVRDSISGAASTPNHVALIENNTAGGSGDVLVLKLAEVGNGIDGGNNYISFHDGNSASLGAIQGNGSGSIELVGAGNDYAEYLPKLDPHEAIQPGDVVGVFQGKVSHRTTGADFLLVASTGAIVAGNDPGEDNREAFVLTAFVGQAELRVAGPVRAGDLIIPSGREDGTGMALHPENLEAALFSQVVGQAWESSPNEGIIQVRSLVGLVQPSALASALENLDQRLARMERMMGTQ